MQTAYKIFTQKSNGKLKSFNSSLHPSIRFTYKKKGVNRAKVGRFFVFKRLKDAQAFLGEATAENPIWRVRVDGLKKTEMVMDPFNADVRDYFTFWRYDVFNCYDMETPRGTYTAKTVELIAQVQ